MIFRVNSFVVFQLSVMAKDLGSPTHSSVAQVKVEVARNNHAPTFNPATYASSIDFNKSPGSFIKKVSARDADGSVSGFVPALKLPPQ